MSLSVASLHVYPIKSLGGFSVDSARLTDRGFEHDRRWMLVDENDRFLTQRDVSMMACLHASPSTNGFRVTDVRDGSTIDLPWSMPTGDTCSVSIWTDTLDVICAPHEASDWFKAKLERPCALVHMPESTLRPTDRTYAEATNSLSDGFPYLVLSQATLDDLNDRLEVPIGMERFRPNIVIDGGIAFQEDGWRAVAFGAHRFSLVKPCARCAITTTDQRTGDRSGEPMRTLARYRAVGNKVLFGMNAIGDTSGSLRVGDMVIL